MSREGWELLQDLEFSLRSKPDPKVSLHPVICICTGMGTARIRSTLPIKNFLCKRRSLAREMKKQLPRVPLATPETITFEEELVFRNQKEKFVNTVITSLFLSTLFAWKATKKYGLVPRLVYSTGAFFVGGEFGITWAQRSCLEPVIAADGSRMQRELANIMLRKHQEPFGPSSFISKHLYKLLYPEQVFADSHPDRSFTRWRFRNFYEEGSVASSNPKPRNEFIPRGKQMNQVRDAQVALGGVVADPLDCIFGPSEGSEVAKSNVRVGHSRSTSRAQRREERRRRAGERAQSTGATSL